jgi:DNA-binding response OmpR family regulator
MDIRPVWRCDTRSVLLLEQEHQVGEAIRAGLRARGFSCHVCATEEAADALLERTRPSLIVVAAWLADRRGSEVCQRLSARCGLREAPVIYLTSNQTADVICRRGPCGGVYSLRKPCDPEVLGALAARLLAAHAGRPGSETALRALAPEFSASGSPYITAK